MSIAKDHGPTLADVARLAGVSTATVSRCLNAPERVSPATRAAVMAAVEALGYAPNHAARMLAAKRSDTIGAVIPTMENAVFARGVQAFQEALGEAGKTLLIASSCYDPAEETRQIRTLVARGADALLLIGLFRAPEVYEFLAARGVPAVAAWAYHPDGPCPSVGFDNHAAMRRLGEAVLEAGHRRIGMVSAYWAQNDRAAARVAGLREAVARAGLDADAVPVVETDYTIDTGRQATAALLDRHPDLTAICCGNDVLAVAALLEARARGLSVPEDLSVTGFDDIELARIASPALTTVHVPHRKMGRRASEVLLAMLRGERPQSVELGTELCRRASLGPPGR